MKEVSFDFENVGGLLEVYAVPLGSFRRISHDYAAGTRTALLRYRDNIIVIPMYAGDSYQFRENKDEADGGTYYDVTISGVIPKQMAENESLVEELERGQWLVLSRDNNGVIRLSGTADVPMRFNTQKDTGQAFASLNGIAFTLTAKESEPSIIIDAAAITDL